MALKHVEEEINMAMQRRLGSADANLRLVLDLVGATIYLMLQYSIRFTSLIPPNIPDKAPNIPLILTLKKNRLRPVLMLSDRWIEKRDFRSDTNSVFGLCFAIEKEPSRSTIQSAHAVEKVISVKQSDPHIPSNNSF